MEAIHRVRPGCTTKGLGGPSPSARGGRVADVEVDGGGTSRQHVDDVRDWMVAWVDLTCIDWDDRPVPTFEWRAGDGNVRGIQVCAMVTVASIDAAHAAGANLVVAGRSVLEATPGPSVAALLPVVRWAALLSRHGMSCLVVPAMLVGARGTPPLARGPDVVAARLSLAFPGVPVGTYAGE